MIAQCTIPRTRTFAQLLPPLGRFKKRNERLRTGRNRSGTRDPYRRDGNLGAGGGAELETYAAVTSSLALNGSFSATGPSSVKFISMSVAGV